MFEISPDRRVGNKGSQCQRLVGRQVFRLVAEALPDGPRHALRIVRAWWKQVDDKQMDSQPQRVFHLVEKLVNVLAAILVSRGDDLYQGDDPISAGMTDDECFPTA